MNNQKNSSDNYDLREIVRKAYGEVAQQDKSLSLIHIQMCIRDRPSITAAKKGLDISAITTPIVFVLWCLNPFAKEFGE